MNLYFYFSIGIFLPQLIFAQNLEITCPPLLETLQKLEQIPPSFKIFKNKAPAFWDGVNFTSGEPRQGFSLAPEQLSAYSNIWKFNKNDRIYLSCSYAKTTLELYQVLPENIANCTVYYDRYRQSSSGPIPKKINCTLR